MAEDDPLNQKVILRQLALLNLSAEIADDGNQALIMAREGAYSMLLTDLHMPDMDGYALARKIRSEGICAVDKSETPRQLPILALTADARQQVVDSVYEAGIDGLLIKPVTLKALDAALRPWLGNGTNADEDRAQQAAAAPAPEAKPAAEPASTQPVLDLTELSARIGDDEDLQHEFLTEFHNQMTPIASEIQEAASARDLHKVGALAHRLKSTSRAIGAMELGSVCAHIEDACRKEDPDELSPLLARFGRSSEAVGLAIARTVGSEAYVSH